MKAALACLCVMFTLAAGAAMQPGTPEATSLLGKPLYAPQPSESARPQLEANLAASPGGLRKAPNDADALIWLGRRTAYLGRYRETIDIFTKGIAQHPNDARMYRHRGHRYVTVREFDRAIADFEKAAALVAGKPDEIEPDGQPNARNIPTSTLQSNIFYHLGLAHYLKGDFEKAADAYRRCMAVSKNPDMLVATTHWYYMTLRRLDRKAEADALLAPITADMDIIENTSYHELLMMYQGEAAPEKLSGSGLDGATKGYGVANWHLYNDRRDEALKILAEIVESNAAQWPAFGYIAAEADLARLRASGASARQARVRASGASAFAPGATADRSARQDEPVATYSILGFDPETGEIGGAVQSRVFSVGNGVLWAEADVGVVATQAIVDVSYGPKGLALLRAGMSPAAIVHALWESDPDPRPENWTKHGRQFAVMDAKGNYTAFTGPKASAWAGHTGGKFATAQGNILAGEAVVAGMVEAFEKSEGPLSLRLMAALDAGEAAGGDTRGRMSAAMLVVRKNGGVWLNNDVVLRLQVDHSDEPLKELRRLVELHNAQRRRR
jgi:uncharacterized Ntn-hydrolase superfamily protein